MTLQALQLYTTNTNDSALPNARSLALVTGAGSTTPVNTKCGTSTGYGQLFSQSSAAAWPALGAIAAPDGHGFLLDPSVLLVAGGSIPAGNWTVVFRSKISILTATADLLVPLYAYNLVSQTYRSLATFAMLSQALTTTSTIYTFAAAALSQIVFASNETLYFETWENISINNSGSAAATVSIVEAISATQGSATATNILTPGFQAPLSFGGGGSHRRGSVRNRRAA